MRVAVQICKGIATRTFHRKRVGGFMELCSFWEVKKVSSRTQKALYRGSHVKLQVLCDQPVVSLCRFELSYEAVHNKIGRGRKERGKKKYKCPLPTGKTGFRAAQRKGALAEAQSASGRSKQAGRSAKRGHVSSVQ